MWELNDQEVKGKIALWAKDAGRVAWSQTAERDIASTAGVTKQGVLEGLLDHLACGYVVEADHMKNQDLAYIFHCFVGAGRLYVKLKFIQLGAEERMFVFSAHVER